MSLKETIMADVKEAMKSKEMEKLTVLRFIHSSIKNKEIEVRPNELTSDDELQVIKKLAKQRQESIEQFSNAGRQDLADKEKAELEIISKYLPEQMPREKVEALVASTIESLGATSIKDMGKVMKEVLAQSKGAADNKVVSEIVKAKLQ
ncbi:MAG: GatB/YqeY domain-containing protein [Bdellovibrionales bacterium]|nr:GatB/YqeY domain-containing protein [Bdellovibrionales bacterium]